MKNCSNAVLLTMIVALSSEPEKPDLSEGSPKDAKRRLGSSVLTFGVSLGVTSVAFPLLALQAGFGAGTVGLLAALSAAVQLAAKASLPHLLSRVTDRSLMLASFVTMACAGAVLLTTTTLAAFVVSQAFQGIARGLFWTTGQAHAVRIPGIATRQLGFVQTTAQIGGMIGPAVAGTLAAISLFAALWAAVTIAAIGILFTAALTPMPTYPPRARAPVPIWRRRGIAMGCWAGAVAGTWRGILDSFVPVLLEGAGFSARSIGWLMALADASGAVGTATVARWGREGMGRFVPLTTFGLALGLVFLPLSQNVVVIALCLVVAGLTGGTAGVLSTAAINDSVKSDDQGAALALVGVYRAGARTATPALISAALLVVSLPVALVGAAAAVTVPSVWLRAPVSRPVDSAGAGP